MSLSPQSGYTDAFTEALGVSFFIWWGKMLTFWLVNLYGYSIKWTKSAWFKKKKNGNFQKVSSHHLSHLGVLTVDLCNVLTECFNHLKPNDPKWPTFFWSKQPGGLLWGLDWLLLGIIGYNPILRYNGMKYRNTLGQSGRWRHRTARPLFAVPGRAILDAAWTASEQISQGQRRNASELEPTLKK